MHEPTSKFGRLGIEVDRVSPQDQGTVTSPRTTESDEGIEIDRPSGEDNAGGSRQLFPFRKSIRHAQI